MVWKSDNIKNTIKGYEQLSDWGVAIPTTDDAAYKYYKNKKYNWLYNKLLLCERQGIPCGPVGISPNTFPVVVKPIYNLLGSSLDAFLVDKEQYDSLNSSGSFWSALQLGDHYSVDLLLVDGEICKSFWFSIQRFSFGMVDHYSLLQNYDEQLYNHVASWVQENLKGYSGCLNIELINTTIIEAHLCAKLIPYFGSLSLLEAIHTLYNVNTWVDYTLDVPNTFYIALLYGESQKHYNINIIQAEAIFKDLTHYKLYSTFIQGFSCLKPKKLAMFCDTSLDKVCNARNIAVSLYLPDIQGKYVLALTNFEDLRT
jgi:hypothetical protein